MITGSGRCSKPTNVFVRSADTKPCILDFGLVFEIDDDDKDRLTTRYAGSIGYVPQEVVTGREASRANHDIYSCGVTLYQAFAGQLPDLQKYVPLSSSKRSLSALDPIIRRSLDDVSNRYRSAKEFAQELGSVMSHIEAVEGLRETNPRAEAFHRKAIEIVQRREREKEEAKRAVEEREERWAIFNDTVVTGSEQAFKDMLPIIKDYTGEATFEWEQTPTSSGVRSLAGNAAPVQILAINHRAGRICFGYSTTNLLRPLGDGTADEQAVAWPTPGPLFQRGGARRFPPQRVVSQLPGVERDNLGRSWVI
jgi:serine/threonine protein kinase